MKRGGMKGVWGGKQIRVDRWEKERVDVETIKTVEGQVHMGGEGG